jgi:hypothetical protein
VTAFDVVGTKSRFAPLNAFISSNGESFAGKEIGRFTCDDGGVCVAYNLLDNPDILKVILDGQFEINVNRYKNSSDVSVPIAIDRDRPELMLKFAQ